MLPIFLALIQNRKKDKEKWEEMERLMAARAANLFKHACDGFNITIEQAIELLDTPDIELSAEDQARKLSLNAALENLVDFAVAEEYQMLLELEDAENDLDEEEIDEEDYYAAFEKIFNKYNIRFACVENHDAEYAMIVAAYIATIRNRSTLTYMTQQDERVRPWHRQFEGFTATKADFPSWLIPPIEWACRCYLIQDYEAGVGDKVKAAATKTPEMPEWFNPVFKESVAKGGRIFSDEHPYFEIKKKDTARLKKISKRIKEKIHGRND